MGDFDACRFDFRIDGKNGLTPSKRKKGFKRSVYNTLFKCKVCGSLFENRQALLAHKSIHSEHQCTFCDRKFKKKNHLREHVNIVHYIDKLKAGYKSEYGRSKSVSGDLSSISSLPPLIPVSDIDQEVECRPSSDSKVEALFNFGTDAMATSSPICGSQSAMYYEANNKLENDQSLDFPVLPSVPIGGDKKPSTVEDNKLCESPDSKLSQFPFGCFLPTGMSGSYQNPSKGGIIFPPSALQSAMASFYPFNQSATPETKTEDNDEQQNTFKSTSPLTPSEEATPEDSIRNIFNNSDPSSVDLSASNSDGIECDTNLNFPVMISPNASLPVATRSSSLPIIPMPPLISPTNRPASKQVDSQIEPDASITSTSNLVMSSAGIQSMSKINLGKLLTTPPIPDLSVLTSIASNQLNISSTNPMSLLPQFPAAASFPILTSVGPSTRTAISDQAVTSITPSSLQSVMTAPVPTSTKPSLPVIMPKPNGLPQNPFKPITSSSVGATKVICPSVGTKPHPQSLASPLNLLRSCSLPPVAPVAPPPNIFLTPSSGSSGAVSCTEKTVSSAMRQHEPVIQGTSAALSKIPSSSSSLSGPYHPLSSLTSPTVSGMGVQVSVQQPKTPVPTPSPVTTKPLPPPASLASFLTGAPLQAGVPGGIPAAAAMQASLPPGYMMMTLVLTTQPGGGVAAVPLIPGYSYPGLTSKTATVQATAGSSIQPSVMTPEAVSSQVSRCMIPPVNSRSVGSRSLFNPSTAATLLPQLSTSTPRFSLLSPIAMKHSEIEPGEITKPPQTLAKALHQQLVVQNNEKLTANGENRYFLNLTRTESDNASSKNCFSPSPFGAVSMSKMTNMDITPEMNKSQDTSQMDITEEANVQVSATQLQGVQQTNKSNKRKQSFPAKNTQVKKQQTLNLDNVNGDFSEGEELAVKSVVGVEDVLDLSSRRPVACGEEETDRAAMLDQYSQEMETEDSLQDYPHKDTISCSSSSSERHSQVKGLTKMVDKLWKYKKHNRSTPSDNQHDDSLPTLPSNLTTDSMNEYSESLSSDPKVRQQNTNNCNNNHMMSRNEQPSTPIADPEDMISDTAKQVYIQMMNTGLKMLEDGDSTPATPLLPPQIPSLLTQQNFPLKVSECETGSGTFGHYRIKKPRFDDYCTFKFHTCKVCKKLFNTAEQMWDHALIHKELQRFKCSFKGCGYSSASREKLLQHKATAHSRGKKNVLHPGMESTTPLENADQNQLSNAMDEFTLLGQQQHYACEFNGCDSVFFSASELMKHVDRVHQKLQCPEAGCLKMFYTMGGLKSHQMSHLDEEEEGEDENRGVGPFACTLCGKTFNMAKTLRAHMASGHGGIKSLVCPLCQYSAKHRSSMNWHMKSRHNLEKVMTTKMGKNQTVYMDASGNMVCSFRSDKSGAVDLSETSSGDGDVSGQSTNGLLSNDSPHLTESDSRLMNGSPANITMEMTQGQEVEIVKNEPEELSVGDNNTIETTDGTVLAPPSTYRSELLYVQAYNDNSTDQPLDFSMKKQPQPNLPTDLTVKTTTASPVPNVIDSSGSFREEAPPHTKTPVGIVQPFLHLPAVSQALYVPQLLSTAAGDSGDVTPPLPQLVPMANPFIPPGLATSNPQFMSMQGGGATGSNTPPIADVQFFSFKLNNNNNNSSTKKASSSGSGVNKRVKSGGGGEKNLEPTTFGCSECGLVFECAEIMWHHKLQEHKDTTNIYCDTCTYETKYQAELQSHMMCTHGKEVGDHKTFACFICNKGYSSKLGLNHHLMRHAEGGPPQFPCPYRGCDAVLHSRGALGNHVKRVHLKPTAKQTVIDESKQVFYCDYPRCDRSFRESKHLRVHRMTHTDEKPLKCHLCEYSCRQRNSMNWHMKSKHGLEKKVSLDGKTIYV